MNAHRAEERLGRTCKTKKLIHEGVDAVDLMDNEVGESLAKIRFAVTLWEQLGKSLDRYQRVLNLMGHPGRQRAETGQPIAAADLKFEPFQRSNVGNDNESA